MIGESKKSYNNYIIAAILLLLCGSLMWYNWDTITEYAKDYYDEPGPDGNLPPNEVENSIFTRTSVTSSAGQEIKNKIRTLFSLQDEIKTLEDGIDNQNEVAPDLNTSITPPTLVNDSILPIPSQAGVHSPYGREAIQLSTASCAKRDSTPKNHSIQIIQPSTATVLA